MTRQLTAAAALSCLFAGAAAAQEAPAVPPPPVENAATAGKAAEAAVDPATVTPANIETALVDSEHDYRIGPEDLLDISVWKNLS
jgi:protein involved in polysaccharide export with SLBB domain